MCSWVFFYSEAVAVSRAEIEVVLRNSLGEWVNIWRVCFVNTLDLVIR